MDAERAATSQARIRVFALDGGGVMGDDASDADFSIAGALLPPGAAYDLMARVDGTDLVLDWKRPATDLDHGPVDHFRVMRATSAQGPFTQIGTPTGETFSDPLAGTASDAAVFYKVTAVNAAGETN